MAYFYGKTVEEAILNGLKEMDLDRSQVEVKVIEEPTKGFLGINAKKAKVEISEIKSDGERAVGFLNGLFDIMQVTAKCNISEEDERIVIDLITDDSSALIGYRGEVLDALQCLAGAIANTGRSEYRRVVVDCEGYRGKREETLVALANKLAQKAVRTGRKVTLEPMTPYERRILHSTLAESPDVKTQSEGKEPNRYVAIIPNNMKPGGDRKFDERKGNRDYKGKRDDRRRGGKKDETPRQPRPKTSGFGTFLGNSLKDGNKTEE